MNQDQVKSLLSLCGGNNSSAKELNVKVDPDARRLQMDVITPGEITRYLRAPTPEYNPPQEVTDVAKKAIDAPAEPRILPPTPPATPPHVQSNVSHNDSSVTPHESDGAYNVDTPALVRIATALERIADVLEARFPEVKFAPPGTEEAFPFPHSSVIELASKKNRTLNDDPNT